LEASGGVSSPGSPHSGQGGEARAPFRAGLPAAEVETALKASLAALQQAERNSVLWFGEIVRRRLYRKLGCSSIQQYAQERLGFSLSKLRQFLRLTQALENLPQLRAAVADGDVPWTRARVVASVATANTESRWVDAARTRSRRDLEAAVKRARREAEETRQGQVSIALGPPAALQSGIRGALLRTGTGRVESGAPVEVPLTKSLRLTPVQAARYEALLEKLRNRHVAGSREDLVLAALECLVEATRVANPPRCPAPTHQVVVQLCPQCGDGTVGVGGRPRKLSSAALLAVLCDTRVSAPGQPNRSSVPPTLRRTTLERDGFACRVRGCRNTRFLEVHHVNPRNAGGPNRLENLLTLCSACHHLVHEHGGVERRLVAHATRPRAGAATGRMASKTGASPGRT